MICDRCRERDKCSGLVNECEVLSTVVLRTEFAMTLENVTSIRSILIGTIDFLERFGCKTNSDIGYLESLIHSGFILASWFNVKESDNPEHIEPPEGAIW